jgi:hypothetical protein
LPSPCPNRWPFRPAQSHCRARHARGAGRSHERRNKPVTRHDVRKYYRANRTTHRLQPVSA